MGVVKVEEGGDKKGGLVGKVEGRIIGLENRK